MTSCYSILRYVLPVVLVVAPVTTTAVIRHVDRVDDDESRCEDPITPGGPSLRVFKLEDTLKHLFPPQNDDLPEHLKYSLHMDQAGAINTDYTLYNIFPANLVNDFPVGSEYGGQSEAALVFPDNPSRIQPIDSCNGGWLLFYTNITEVNSKPIIMTGLESIDDRVVNGFCNYTFVWNRDFTKVEINSGFNSLFGVVIGTMFDLFIELSAELEPYWAWKFGISIPRRKQLSEEEYNELDRICCPVAMDDPTNPCWGEATLGVNGSACETISMACPGKISLTDAQPCGMWKRVTSGILGFPDYGTYSMFPIGDKYGNPTPFFDKYVEVLKNMSGLDELFYGQQEPCE
eukprot:CAMPEP_0118692668 /NCGR_PEP_ID=MMETSP0800-20121206/11433_1 /TAXON_ID=210618 ORGANISM="Striatella unipunctata, Strain CCMP2910" /NCGR_SAMPLE_ID=MMETSP0800 /ASSEMBLY_ACC=CAM_ASM_000638 /LENGTH=345 /DNA_ID=CAMNT_0006590723 /DNA_START=186 /DNA_END=1223 /DNA_ORIENTATION=+